MLKKTITYTDFNDEEVSEDFFFHLSKAELVELEMSHEGGMAEALQRIVDAEDGKSIVAEFKSIILGAYGKKSADGRRFVKNQQIREEFESSEAYSTLFMELVTNADAAAEFMNGIIPQGMAEEAAKVTALQAAPDPEPKLVNKDEVLKMTDQEIEQVWQQMLSGEAKMPEGESLIEWAREAREQSQKSSV